MRPPDPGPEWEVGRVERERAEARAAEAALDPWDGVLVGGRLGVRSGVVCFLGWQGERHVLELGGSRYEGDEPLACG